MSLQVTSALKGRIVHKAAPRLFSALQATTSMPQVVMTSVTASAAHLVSTVMAVPTFYQMDHAPLATTAQGVKSLPPL